MNGMNGKDPKNSGNQLNMAGRPFTRYRAAELAVCAVAVILGLLYLNTELVSLSLLLPFYCLCFLVIPILRWLEGRALGLKGAMHWITIACWILLAVAMIAVTIGYMGGGGGA